MRTIIALLHLFALGVVIGCASCATTARVTGTTARTVIDCAAAVAPGELAKAVQVAEATFANALRPDGSYDTAALLDVARSMSLATAGCALAEAVSRLRPAVNMRLATSPAESPLDAAWRTVQTEQLGGRAFRVASGAVL